MRLANSFAQTLSSSNNTSNDVSSNNIGGSASTFLPLINKMISLGSKLKESKWESHPTIAKTQELSIEDAVVKERRALSIVANQMNLVVEKDCEEEDFTNDV